MKHFSILILLLLATSCDKDSEPNNNPILNGSYKNTSVRYSPPIDYNFDGKLETEIIDLFDKCTMDNLIVFVDSKRGYYDNGLLLCLPGTEPKIEYFQWWLFNENHSIGVIEDLYPDYKGTNEIEILSDSTFILINYRNEGGIKDYYTILSTFTKVK